VTTGALPVGLISLSDNDPEDKGGYEASGDDGRLKLSKGNQNAVIKALWLQNWKPYCQGANGSPPATSGDFDAK
jgi:hypothetical protein